MCFGLYTEIGLQISSSFNTVCFCLLYLLPGFCFCVHRCFLVMCYPFDPSKRSLRIWVSCVLGFLDAAAAHSPEVFPESPCLS